MNVTTSPASSAFMVIASSLPAHFNILAYMRSKASTTRRASFKNSLLVPPVDKHLARLYRPSRPPPRRSARPTPRIHFPRIYPPPMPHPRRAQTRARRPERARSPPPHRPRTTRVIQSSCTQTRAARRTIFARFIPIVNGRSHRKCANPSECNFNDTSETWDESMAWSLNPSIGSASKFASVTRSLIESRTFLRMEPWFKRASNIAVLLCCVRMCVRVRRADV